MRFSKIRSCPFALAPAAVLLLLAIGFQAQGLPAQTDPPEEEDEVSYGPAPREDPGVDSDPTPAEDLAVFGLPLVEETLDPEIAVEELALPEGIAPLGPSQTVTPTSCEGWTNPVTPLGIRASDGHYFTYAQQPILMVGVSADAGCHLDLEDGNKCRYGSLPGATPSFPQNYPQIFADLKAKGLNKIRLWVALGADPNRPSTSNVLAKRARNQPFALEGTYYRLDVRYDDYFNRLREVVIAAKKLDLFVEVTLFAPFEGEPSSLWLAQSNLAKAFKPGTTTLESVGFTDSRWFALKTDAGHSADLRMRDFQKNVIDWTVKWLWCYDNVYWEVANEPERADADPVLAAKWQQEMIAYIRLAEDTYRATNQFPGRPLKARHPVAVQPFTTAAAAVWRTLPPASAVCSVGTPDNCRPDVINGHYTQVKTNPAAPFPATSGKNRLDLGAIRLVRENHDLKKVFGMNEDNITPFDGAKGTRTLKTDVLPIPFEARQFGLPDPVRAEAWEFLLHGGGAFDHFGYIYDSDSGQKVRTQLGKISAFLAAGSLVFSLAPSPALSRPISTIDGTAWVEVGAYPTDTSWDAATLSRKHWAAMESPGWQTTDTGRKFLLYVHHSTPRCKLNNDDFDRRENPTTHVVTYTCAGVNLALNAYDGRRRPMVRYQEVNLKLHLGSKAGIFTVAWLDPTQPSAAPLAQEMIDWKPSPESCSGRTPCTITSPKYGYDIVLRIVR